MNRVFLSGRLARDPEIRFSQGGSPVARVSIAVNRPFAKDTVDFFSLVAFGKVAEFLNKYFSKGSKLLVEGHLRYSTYEDKQGVKRYNTDVIVDNIESADSKGAKGKTQAPRDTPNDTPKRDYDDFGGEPVDPEDTPF